MKESSLSKNPPRNTKESFLRADPQPNQMLSQVTQLSKLEASQPWETQTHTDIAESMDVMSNFSMSHLAESVVTRETKLISTHKRETLLEQFDPLGAKREVIPPDFNRRFSKNSASPNEMNEIFNFSKKKDCEKTKKKVKLMNEKLDLKYQRLHQKRFQNMTSGNLIEDIIQKQQRERSRSNHNRTGSQLEGTGLKNTDSSSNWNHLDKQQKTYSSQKIPSSPFTPSPKLGNFFVQNKEMLFGKYFHPEKISLSGLRHVDFLHLKEPELRNTLIKNVIFNVRLYYLNDQFHQAYSKLTKCVELIESCRDPSIDPTWISSSLFSLHNYRLMIHFLRQIKLHHGNAF
jgi:hypothetical protein